MPIVVLAKTIDSNSGLVTRAAKLKIDRLDREVRLLSIAYGQVVENTERAEFSLKNAMPFFQVVDEPLMPLDPKKESKFRAIIIGGILGGFLACLFVIGRKVFRDAMRDDHEA